MKVVLVGPAHPFRGGISHYNMSLYQCLAQDNEVLLIAFKRLYPDFLFPGRTQKDDSGEPFQVPSEAILDSVSPASWKKAARRIIEFDPQIALFQWWQPFFGPCFRQIIQRVRSLSSCRILFLCHNIFGHEKIRVPGSDRLEVLLTRQALSLADAFLVHSDSMVPALKRFNPRAPVRKIYHPLYDFFLEWDRSQEAEVEEPGRPQQLLFFGKIRNYKGLGVFLRALGLMITKVPYRAVIAGEFYIDPAPYRRLVRDLGLHDRVVWRDRYISNEEVPELFRSSDVVVLPYREATQSGVVPIAYQFEVPVIASDVGGLSEVVIPGDTGFLVPPEDPEALAGAIDAFLAIKDRESFRRNIREFRQRLTWRQVADNIFDLASEFSRP